MHELPAISDLAVHSFFIDFDGTLVDIVDRPELARLSPATVDIIVRMYERLGGALAIISGRDIAIIDRFFSPHVLPVAGVHGLRRRDAYGHLHEALAVHTFGERVHAEVFAILGEQPGILIEDKPGAVAIHYRAVPQAAAICRLAAHSIAGIRPDLNVLEGHMVVELKPKSHNKGTAIREFMAEAPFAGRCPVFIGDDMTDEDGFRAINEIGGLAVKVGSGTTVAPFRVTTTAAVNAWLAQLSASQWRGYDEQS